jgi:putative transposase
MKDANIWVRYKKYKATTNSEHNKSVSENELEQDFYAQQHNQAWGKVLPKYGLQKAGYI